MHIDFNSAKKFFSYSVKIIYVLYAVIIIAIIVKKLNIFKLSKKVNDEIRNYINNIHYFLKIYISLFLIIFYNPFIDVRNSKLEKMDKIEKDIIYNSGILLFLSVVVIDSSVVTSNISNLRPF